MTERISDAVHTAVRLAFSQSSWATQPSPAAYPKAKSRASFLLPSPWQSSRGALLPPSSDAAAVVRLNKMSEGEGIPVFPKRNEKKEERRGGHARSPTLIQSGAAAYSEGFVKCFLKVPLACMGSMAAAVQPNGP